LTVGEVLVFGWFMVFWCVAVVFLLALISRAMGIVVAWRGRRGG